EFEYCVVTDVENIKVLEIINSCLSETLHITYYQCRFSIAKHGKKDINVHRQNKIMEICMIIPVLKRFCYKNNDNECSEFNQRKHREVSKQRIITLWCSHAIYSMSIWYLYIGIFINKNPIFR
ncbi:hypothetical protein L9F63_002548, partial [Diploptera punctata]